MKIINHKIILFFIILLIIGFQCPEDEEDLFENIYELELPYKIAPVQKEYRINDTIQIFALIEDQSLKDLNSQNLVRIECSNIPIRLYIGVRHSNINLIDDDNLFETIIDTINFQDYRFGNSGQSSNLIANISEDVFDDGEISIMKIVPKRKGVYMINPYQVKAIIMNRNENCNEMDPVFDKGDMNYIFDVENSNPELLDESPLPHNVFIVGDHVPSGTEEKRIFWFKVID